MTFSEEGHKQPILDLGNMNDLQEGRFVIWVASKEDATAVLGVFSWIEEEMSRSEPETEEGKARKAMFERAYKLIHKRVRYSEEFDNGTD